MTMSLTDSILNEAALDWFHLRPVLRDYGEQVGEQTRVAQTHTPPLCLRLSPLRSGSQGAREKREAIRRLNPAIPEGARELSAALIGKVVLTHERQTK